MFKVMLCPCGSEEKYESCCQPLHQGLEIADSAVKLMQSRYCAFVVKSYGYLKETTDPQTTLEFDHNANKEWGDRVQFQKLEILQSEEIRNKAQVEFVAHFIENQITRTHHEISRFRRLEGVWYYRDGQVKATQASPQCKI